MFRNFKIKRQTKKVKQHCDAMKFSLAYVEALELMALLDENQSHPETLKLILERAGMDQKHIDYYVANYKCNIRDATFDDFLEYQEKKKVLHPEKVYEIDYETIETKLADKLINDDEATIEFEQLKLDNFEKAFPDIQQPELIEAEKLRLRKNILTARFRNSEIGFMGYQKSLASLNNEKWLNYEIKIDPDADRPDAFEIQFDYNEEFVQWLKHHGVTLTPQEEESLGEDESYADKLTEKWVKSSLISLAAGMLQDDGGETFRSVVASEPEAQLVENLEIDSDQLDEMRENLSEEDFNKVIEFSKQRKMYR